MSERVTFRITTDTKAMEKEFEHLFRLMRARKIEETQFDILLYKIVIGHTFFEVVAGHETD